MRRRLECPKLHGVHICRSSFRPAPRWIVVTNSSPSLLMWHPPVNRASSGFAVAAKSTSAMLVHPAYAAALQHNASRGFTDIDSHDSPNTMLPEPLDCVPFLDGELTRASQCGTRIAGSLAGVQRECRCR